MYGEVWDSRGFFITKIKEGEENYIFTKNIYIIIIIEKVTFQCDVWYKNKYGTVDF